MRWQCRVHRAGRAEPAAGERAEEAGGNSRAADRNPRGLVDEPQVRSAYCSLHCSLTSTRVSIIAS